MSFNFVKNLLSVKASKLSDDLIDLTASIDPEAVSETAIRQKMDEHDVVLRQLVEAKADWEKEYNEYKNELDLYNRRMSAAEKAQRDLEADPNNQEAATALSELLDSIEKHVPILEREKQEADSAKVFLDQLQEASQDIANELKTLRALVNEQQRAIKQADIEMERNRKMAEQAQVLAGLKKSSNKFDTALSALKKQADEKQKQADLYKLKTEQLTVKVSKTSTAVDKYMTDVHDTPKTTESLQERLARLKK